jgi:hypothetical protein
VQVLIVRDGAAGTVQQIWGSVSQSGSTTGNGKASTLVGARYPAGPGSICGNLLGVCGVGGCGPSASGLDRCRLLGGREGFSEEALCGRSRFPVLGSLLLPLIMVVAAAGWPS